MKPNKFSALIGLSPGSRQHEAHSTSSPLEEAKSEAVEIMDSFMVCMRNMASSRFLPLFNSSAHAVAIVSRSLNFSRLLLPAVTLI
jgi:hypothetical protein